jgi:hypothetical protein
MHGPRPPDRGDIKTEKSNVKNARNIEYGPIKRGNSGAETREAILRCGR